MKKRPLKEGWLVILALAVVGIRVVGEEEEKDEATIVEGRNEKDWIFLRVSQASW